MNSAVVAAIIAASVSLLTLIGTLAAQFYDIRKTSGGTDQALQQQREQLDRILAEQRGQLDRALAEQREQLDRTLTEQRTRTLNERFAAAAGQLGGDKPPAVRLAGVYAMAGLADDWEELDSTANLWFGQPSHRGQPARDAWRMSRHPGTTPTSRPAAGPAPWQEGDVAPLR